MYGAFIGDIIGSKYEFHNIKTKDFPLFSIGCDYTDDTIMTVAVAKAIMRSREAQFNKEAVTFREILVDTMKDFGRRYPHPTGAYGGKFAQWLRQENPQPYGSYGNGSAMRVSPCGLAAVTMEEALALARASASVSHNHPEGIKGAEAVAAAIYLAKCEKSKEEIKKYIAGNYYDLNFTLDSIREKYAFDGSCQGSVPQAIVAFLESESFEDAIRNVVSIGGDCDTTGAITGSIAWIYYAVQTGGYSGWVYDKFDSSMLEIKKQASAFLPSEFTKIADEFHEICWRRAGTFYRVGGCTPILSSYEEKNIRTEQNNQQQKTTSSLFDAEIEKKVDSFCKKYIVLMELLYQDQELNHWCRNYSAYQNITTHIELKKMIYDGFVKEAYDFMPKILSQKPYGSYSLEAALAGSRFDLAFGICLEIRGDYASNGSLIYSAIGRGNLYRLMAAFLVNERSFLKDDKRKEQNNATEKKKVHGGKAYSLEYIKSRENCVLENRPGGRSSSYDSALNKWRMRIQLDVNRIWFLSVFLKEDGAFEKYSLDKELADDSHYEFSDEKQIRQRLFSPGDENRYFAEVLIRYIAQYSGEKLLSVIKPYITAQYHYD